MSGSTGFFVGAAALLLVTLAILLRPLLRKHKSADAADHRRQANLDILRDELRELESNRAEGSLSESDFEQARRELQRRLLEEVEPTDNAAPAARDMGPSAVSGSSGEPSRSACASCTSCSRNASYTGRAT